MKIFAHLAWLPFGLALAAAGQSFTPVFDYHQINSVADVALHGDAEWSAKRLRLTHAAAHRRGGAWHASKRFVRDGFETVFAFQFTGGGAGGGEGFAFVVQGSAVPALGPAGVGLGYAGIPNSVAVEFDARESAGLADAPADHISVQTRGALANSADHAASLGTVAVGLPDFADGQAHTARIVYQPGSMQVFVDGGAEPVLTVALDLAATIELDRGQAWFGFTAATGEGYQTHEILSWSFATAATAVTTHLAAPLNGASFLAPAAVVLEASAGSTGGGITRVQFFQGTRLVGQATNSPFQFLWENVPPGSYVLTATAFDEQGQSGVSPPVKITVLPTLAPIGINFASGANTGEYALNAAARAGVVAQFYWNNVPAFTNGNGVSPNLKDALGVITPADVTFDLAAPGEEPSLNGALSADHQLMKAFLLDRSGMPGAQTNSAITFAQIPFPVYDVIVYSDSDNQGADCVAQFRVGTNSVYLRDGAWSSFAGIYAPAAGAVDLGSGTVAGNYVRFNGFTSNSFTLFVNARSAAGGAPRAAVNAVQIVPSIYDVTVPPVVTRGPYLQTGTPTSVIVRWRTNRPLPSHVRYGTNAAALDQSVTLGPAVTEHTVPLTGLTPDTRYYYAIGTSETNLVAGADYFFVTAPAGSKPTRIWVIGDSGTANANARAVRDAYYDLAGSRYTDVWLMLGDNAYNSGTDAEFQAAVFDMYPSLLRQTVLWSTVGNHETAQSHNPNINTVPYFRIFDFPQNGEAGGVPSGTERYYSFDYGNIHFVCLDAMTSDRSSNGPMCNWLRADLEANTNFWLIAFWHHPPYTKGSHDSDNPNGADFELVEMRENVVPILEAHGVDLVMSGHSHCYERSFLLHGHYGYSPTFDRDTMTVDAGSGRDEDDTPYRKGPDTPVPYAGTVYVVAGSSGQATFGTLDHPAMYFSRLNLGSLVLDVNENRMDARFLRETGLVEDTFTIIKTAPDAPFQLTTIDLAGTDIAVSWGAKPGRAYRVQRAENLVSPDWQPVSDVLVATNAVMRWRGVVAPGAATGFYRVVVTGN